MNAKGSPSGMVSEAQRAVASVLLEFGKGEANLANATFADDDEANALLFSDPFAFLIGVIFNAGIDKRRAWRGPLELRRRLGHLDPNLIRTDLAGVTAAIQQHPSLHRLISATALAVVDAADKVVRDYGGDAAGIWMGVTSVPELYERLERIRGIGQKKTAMAIAILRSRGLVEISNAGEAEVAVDRHVRRVFSRTGLCTSDDVQDIVKTARVLSPDDPAALDAAYLVGRRWCHAKTPDCGACVLHDVCATAIGRANRRRGFVCREEVFVVVEGFQRRERATSIETALGEMHRLMDLVGERFPPGSVEIGMRVIRLSESSRIGDDIMLDSPGTILHELTALADELDVENAGAQEAVSDDPHTELTAELKSIADALGGELHRRGATT